YRVLRCCGRANALVIRADAGRWQPRVTLTDRARPPVAEPAPALPPRPVAIRDVVAPPRPLRVLRAYLALTKPRIIELLLVTTVPAMLLAQRRLPSLGLMAAVLAGGALAAGAANALNCYLDRDIDRLMRRTFRRPLPAH